jgi:hypothetical protein
LGICQTSEKQGDQQEVKFPHKTEFG